MIILPRWSLGLIFHQCWVDCARALLLVPLGRSLLLCAPVIIIVFIVIIIIIIIFIIIIIVGVIFPSVIFKIFLGSQMFSPRDCFSPPCHRAWPINNHLLFDHQWFQSSFLVNLSSLSEFWWSKCSSCEHHNHLRTSEHDANFDIIPIIIILKVSIVNLLTTVLNDAPILPEEEAEGTGSIIR